MKIKFEIVDDWLREKLTDVIQWYVRKNKGTKHKFDFMISVTWWGLILSTFCFAPIVADRFIHHKIAGLVSCAVVMTLNLIGTIFTNRLNKEIKVHYDELWQLRKHPIVFNIMKSKTDAIHERDRAMRKWFLIVNLILFGIELALVPAMLPYLSVGFVRIYISSVFDFDDPDEYKKAKDEATEVEKQSWRNLVDSLQPNH